MTDSATLATGPVAVARLVSEATTSVFSMMLDLPVEIGESYVEPSGPADFDGVISIVSLAGPWIGAGRIACGVSLACRIASAMLMMEFDSATGEVLDAMGELANMIIGNTKTALEESVGPLVLSIPTVISGSNYRAWSGGSNKWTVIPMRCGEESFEIRFFLVPAPQNASGHSEALSQLQRR